MLRAQCLAVDVVHDDVAESINQSICSSVEKRVTYRRLTIACDGGMDKSLRMYSIRAISSEPDIPDDESSEPALASAARSAFCRAAFRFWRAERGEPTTPASNGGKARGEAGAVLARNSSGSMLCERMSPVIWCRICERQCELRRLTCLTVMPGK